MNRMAASAGNIRERVFGAADLRACKVAGMASKAVIDNLDRLQLRKGDDGRLAAASLDVRTTRTVAALAAGALGRLLTAGDALVVGVFVEVRPDVRVARPANGATNIIGLLRIGGGGERPGLSQGRPAGEDSEDECAAICLHPHNITKVIV